MIRILIADDHPVVLEGLSKMLSSEEGMEVVGEARDGSEAVRKARQLRPDVVLMDVRMPVMDGVIATREICRELRSRIVILTTYDDDDYVYDGIAAGAKGYLLKDVPKDELFRAIRTVNDGQSLVQPVIATKLFERLSSLASRTSRASKDALSPRELQVLRMIATGTRNKQIGERLSITERTVKAHTASIMRKLSAKTVAEAIALALQRGLI